MQQQDAVKYKFIINDLVAKINSEYYSIGQKLPSEKSLCEIYNVSRITVVNALSELEHSGYIIKKRGKGSFVQKNKTIEYFSTNQISSISSQLMFRGILPKKVGIMIPNISDSYSMNIISGIISILSLPNYHTSIVYSLDREYEDYYIDNFVVNGFDAIIYFPCDSQINNKKVISLNTINFPIILLDRFYQNTPVNFVVSNNKLGSELATNHLIALGHTKIAFYSNSNFFDTTTNIRYNAFEDILIHHNIRDYRPHNMTKVCPRDKRMMELVHSIINKEITAVIASNSSGAHDIINLCAQHHISIPRDLSLICFDNPNTTISTNTNITYIDQKSFKIGTTTGKVVQHLFLHNSSALPFQIYIDPEIIISNSTSAII